MKVWFLVFMFQTGTGLQPMVSGPHELDVCLSMAQQQTRETGFMAHCYRPFERQYPDMDKEYLK